MGAFIVFILKSTVCLTVFYLFYKLLLSRETFHRFNRVALLSMVCFSMLIPLCEVKLKKPVAMQQLVADGEGILAMASVTDTAGGKRRASFGLRALLPVYIGGGALCFGWFAFSCLRMFRVMRRGARRRYKGVWLVVTPEPVVPFSWMRHVLISEKDWEESGEAILAHEMAHVENAHSIDLLFVQACILLHWFNPAAWLLRQELRRVHEYEADESVIQKGIDAKRYQLLLIKKAAGAPRFGLVSSSFNHSSLKKRIAMMLKRKSHPWARLKYLYVLPLVACAIAAFARPQIAFEAQAQAPPDTLITRNGVYIDSEELQRNILEGLEKTKVEIDKVEIAKAVVAIDTEEVQRNVLEGLEKAKIRNGVYFDTEEVQRNVLEGLEKAKAEIDKAVAAIDTVEVQRNILEGLEKAKVEIEKAMIKVDSEEPRKAIREEMEQAKAEAQIVKKEMKQAKEEAQIVKKEMKQVKAGIRKIVIKPDPSALSLPQAALVMVDGKEVTREEMERIPPTEIESVTVLKDELADELYGEKAANGVILIELKKNK
jgi:TonB-dependent SusC/RagA subfamily outer membrane receptor